MRYGLTLNPGDQILKNWTHKTGLDLTLIRGCEMCDDYICGRRARRWKIVYVDTSTTYKISITLLCGENFT